MSLLILAIDSAAAGCAACAMQDDKLLALKQEPMARGQDARLVPLVQETLAAAGIEFPQLDRIAATTGPGSFTGIRIGLATARGFGLAANKPVIGIDRFAIYRAQLAIKDGVIILESKRTELYVQPVSAGVMADPPQMLTRAEIAALLASESIRMIAGDVAEFVTEPLAEPEVLTCARLGLVADPDNPAMLPRPFYVREPDVTISKHLSGH